MLSRKPPDRFTSHFVPGAAVQNSMKQSRIGTYRVVSVLDSNLILERANKLFKWHKNKTRAIHDLEDERFDQKVIKPDIFKPDDPIPPSPQER